MKTPLKRKVEVQFLAAWCLVGKVKLLGAAWDAILIIVGRLLTRWDPLTLPFNISKVALLSTTRWLVLNNDPTSLKVNHVAQTFTVHYLALAGI
jgi:hypothetical protein